MMTTPNNIQNPNKGLNILEASNYKCLQYFIESKIKLILLSTAFILGFSFSSYCQQASSNDNIQTNYAMLSIGYFGLGANTANIIFENGETIDLVKEKIVKIRDKYYTENNFVETCKAFKFLNIKGYQLKTNTCYNMGGSAMCTYLFTK